MKRFVAIDLRPYDTWRMRLLVTILLLAAVAFLPRPAQAFDLEETLKQQHVQYSGKPQHHVSQGGCLSLSQAVESVRRRTNGKIVSADTRVQGGREVHHIKVLTKDGRVKTYRVNGCRR